jgi:hypothetical protein
MTERPWFDRGFVVNWSQQYTLRSRYAAEEAELLAVVGPQIQKRGWYTVPNLQRVNRWKLPTERNRRRLLWNRTEVIKSVTTEALAAPLEGQSSIMQRLHGVGPAVASALLMVPQPDRHTIIDFRAVGALERLQESAQLGEPLPWSPRAVHLPDYLEYLGVCQRLGQNLGVSLRDLDRCLWQWHWAGTP